jgi:hypothetical protein
MTACAGTPPSGSADRNPAYLLTLSPASLGRDLSLSQIVIGDHEGQSYKMRFEVEITPARLAVVGISPLGITLFTLVHERGGQPAVTQLKGKFPFDPRHILFDLYLTYWPTKVFHTALTAHSLHLDEDEAGLVRRVSRPNGDVIAEITRLPAGKSNGETVIHHYDTPYQLRIKGL